MRDMGRKRILVVAAAIAVGAVVTTTGVSMTAARHTAVPQAAKQPAHTAKRQAAVVHRAKARVARTTKAAARRAHVVKARVPARHAAPTRVHNSAQVAMAAVAFALCAKTGTATMPDGVTLTTWGFATKPDGVDCSDASVVAGAPGPVLDVAAGSDVTVTVTNTLAEPVSFEIPQLSVDQTDEVAAGATGTYTFKASRAGTFLYDSPSNAGRQQGMGLFGALVVRPATVGQAYDDASTAYAAEQVLVLSEFDPGLNADPDGYDLEKWNPQYWLINGKAYPDTAHIDAAQGTKLLLRYVNAGLDQNTMTMLGMRATLIARDGWPLGDPFGVIAETVASGQTVDELASVPAGSAGSSLALYNRQLHLSNGVLGAPGHSPGGMLTFVDVTP